VETRILKGKPLAATMREEVSARAAELRDAGIVPTLAVVLVGDDPASRIYSSSIQKAGAKLGVEVRLVEIDAANGAGEIASRLAELGADPHVHGIIVQQPLPKGVPGSVVDAVPFAKDVDGSTAESLGRVLSGREAFAPATARAVVEVLGRAGIEVAGRHVVIVGRSTVVGKPLACLLLRKDAVGNATVTVCHTGTRDLAAMTRTADILVAAMGVPEAIRGSMLAPGVVAIDVGVNRVDDPDSEKGYRVTGDIAAEEALGLAAALTPVPGGVGTLTTTIILGNAVTVAARQLSPQASL